MAGGEIPAVGRWHLGKVVARSGIVYAGLYYPMAIALMTFVVGMIYLPRELDREVDGR